MLRVLGEFITQILTVIGFIIVIIGGVIAGHQVKKLVDKKKNGAK